MNEVERIRQRYERRDRLGVAARYYPLDPSVWIAQQEWERALIRWIKDAAIEPVDEKRVLEVGCGNGDNLIDLLKLGFSPRLLVGNELLESLASDARTRLPSATRIIPGDALAMDIPPGSFDVVLQSTVFSSILDDDFQHRLADLMWRLAAPGGGVLWYDFTFNNPANPDVRGVPVQRVRALFPGAKLTVRRLTLAPPISRRITRIAPSLYHVFNALPLLRTHVLCWIEKPLDGERSPA